MATSVFDILCDTEQTIGGFQFGINSTTNISVVTASGGAAAAVGFLVTATTETVLGFHLGGQNIEPSDLSGADGVLVQLTVEYDGDAPTLCVDELVFSDPSGTPMELEVASTNCLLVTDVDEEDLGDGSSDSPPPALAPLDSGNIMEWNVHSDLDDGSIVNIDNYSCNQPESFAVNAYAVHTMRHMEEWVPYLRQNKKADGSTVSDSNKLSDGSVSYFDHESDRINFENSINDIAYIHSLWGLMFNGYVDSVNWGEWVRTAKERSVTVTDSHGEVIDVVDGYKAFIREYTVGGDKAIDLSGIYCGPPAAVQLLSLDPTYNNGQPGLDATVILYIPYDTTGRSSNASLDNTRLAWRISRVTDNGWGGGEFFGNEGDSSWVLKGTQEVTNLASSWVQGDDIASPVFDGIWGRTYTATLSINLTSDSLGNSAGSGEYSDLMTIPGIIESSNMTYGMQCALVNSSGDIWSEGDRETIVSTRVADLQVATFDPIDIEYKNNNNFDDDIDNVNIGGWDIRANLALDARISAYWGDDDTVPRVYSDNDNSSDWAWGLSGADYASISAGTGQDSEFQVVDFNDQMDEDEQLTVTVHAYTNTGRGSSGSFDIDLLTIISAATTAVAASPDTGNPHLSNGTLPRTGDVFTVSTDPHAASDNIVITLTMNATYDTGSGDDETGWRYRVNGGAGFGDIQTSLDNELTVNVPGNSDTSTIIVEVNHPLADVDPSMVGPWVYTINVSPTCAEYIWEGFSISLSDDPDKMLILCADSGDGEEYAEKDIDGSLGVITVSQDGSSSEQGIYDDNDHWPVDEVSVAISERAPDGNTTLLSSLSYHPSFGLVAAASTAPAGVPAGVYTYTATLTNNICGVTESADVDFSVEVLSCSSPCAFQDDMDAIHNGDGGMIAGTDGHIALCATTDNEVTPGDGVLSTSPGGIWVKFPSDPDMKIPIYDSAWTEVTDWSITLADDGRLGGPRIEWRVPDYNGDGQDDLPWSLAPDSIRIATRAALGNGWVAPTPGDTSTGTWVLNGSLSIQMPIDSNTGMALVPPGEYLEISVPWALNATVCGIELNPVSESGQHGAYGTLLIKVYRCEDAEQRSDSGDDVNCCDNLEHYIMKATEFNKLPLNADNMKHITHSAWAGLEGDGEIRKLSSLANDFTEHPEWVLLCAGLSSPTADEQKDEDCVLQCFFAMAPSGGPDSAEDVLLLDNSPTDNKWTDPVWLYDGRIPVANPPLTNWGDWKDLDSYWCCPDDEQPWHNPPGTQGDENTGDGDVYGCMDPLASNYNPAATIDDGSCETTPLTNHEISALRTLCEGGDAASCDTLTFNSIALTSEDLQLTMTYGDPHSDRDLKKILAFIPSSTATSDYHLLGLSTFKFEWNEVAFALFGLTGTVEEGFLAEQLESLYPAPDPENPPTSKDEGHMWWYEYMSEEQKALHENVHDYYTFFNSELLGAAIAEAKAGQEE